MDLFAFGRVAGQAVTNIAHTSASAAKAVEDVVGLSTARRRPGLILIKALDV
jgi:hypothetical protein